MNAETWTLMEGVAGYGLPGSTRSLPDALDDDGWAALRAGILEQRLTGLFHGALTAGHLGATPERLAQVSNYLVASMGLALELERRITEIADLLGAADVEWRLLKGAAVAHLDYRDPSLRSFGDVDILVRDRQYDQACDVLREAGGHRRYAEPRPGFDRRFGKGVCFFMPGHYELDLHRSFVAGPFGLLVQQADLFAETDHIVLAGKAIPTLSAESRFLHACYHAVLGARPPRLVPLRDVAQLVLNGLDLERVEATISTWKVDALIAMAVNAAWTTFGLADAVPLSEWARSYQPTKVERRQLAAYVSEQRSYAAQAAAALSALPRFVDKVAYVRAIAFPSRDYVRARDGRYRSRLRRGVKLTMSGGGGD